MSENPASPQQVSLLGRPNLDPQLVVSGQDAGISSEGN